MAAQKFSCDSYPRCASTNDANVGFDASSVVELVQVFDHLVASLLSSTVGIKTTDTANTIISRVNLAGAEGFEPSPSSLTVRCPTSWTTPQRAIAGKRAETARCGVVFAKKRVRSISLRYHEAGGGQTAWLVISSKNLSQLPCDEHQKRGVTGFRVLQNERNVWTKRTK